MRVIIFRPKSSPLPIPNLNDTQEVFIDHKDCEIVRYILDLDTFMGHIHHLISESSLRDIPQLIYLIDLPTIFNLTNEYSCFPNIHLLSESNGYYSRCLISNAKYIKPTNSYLGSAYDLMERMYREYKANNYRSNYEYKCK